MWPGSFKSRGALESLWGRAASFHKPQRWLWFNPILCSPLNPDFPSPNPLLRNTVGPVLDTYCLKNQSACDVFLWAMILKSYCTYNSCAPLEPPRPSNGRTGAKHLPPALSALQNSVYRLQALQKEAEVEKSVLTTKKNTVPFPKGLFCCSPAGISNSVFCEQLNMIANRILYLQLHFLKCHFYQSLFSKSVRPHHCSSK